jgi:GntR family transcriptional regulator, trigonelline degradation regulator
MGPERTLRVERKPAPIRTQVLDNLRKAILTRQLAPGQRLIERELVEMTGVSRTSVREALRELAAEGLVSTSPNKGTAVATLSSEQARQIYEVRAVLEGLAGRLFVENATDVQRRALLAQLSKIDRLVSRGGGILEAKDRFYAILFDGAGNDALRDITVSLQARVTYLRSLSLSLDGRPEESLAELHDIGAAIEAGDADAAQVACMRHVDEARTAGLLALNQLQDGSDGVERPRAADAAAGK